MTDPLNYGTVDRVEPNGPTKVVYVSSIDPIVVSRYSPVSEGDELFGRDGGIYIKAKNGDARIYPPFRLDERLHPNWPTFRIKEIDTTEEEQGYKRLSGFHYRSPSLYGRHVPLVVTAHDPNWPKVVGYVVLASDIILNTPRNAFAAAPFYDPMGFGWGPPPHSIEVLKNRLNLFVRVARRVVVPEVRGAGLGVALYRYAVEYAKERFVMGGFKPYFLITSADMLKYHPSAEKAGLSFIGYTKGNAESMEEDLRNATNLSEFRTVGREIGLDGRRVVRAKLGFAEKTKAVAEALDIDLTELAELLGKSPDELTEREYSAIAEIRRYPKPVYVMGLTSGAELYVRERVRAMDESGGITSSRPSGPVVDRLPPLDTPIRVSIDHLSVTSRIEATHRVREVEQSFGLHPDSLEERLTGGLRCTIPSGSCTLITGPSGSGKSVLLSLLMTQDPPEGIKVDGTMDIPENAVFATLSPLDPQVPLVDQLAPEDGDDVRKALFLLNVAGLSEAHAYLKRYGDLSRGQQYRAQIARLIGSGANVWVADEFLSTIDPLTAPVVAGSLRKIASKMGATLILAAPHVSAFVRELKPDQVIQFLPGRDVKVRTGDEFVSGMDTVWNLPECPPVEPMPVRHPGLSQAW